MKVKVLPGTNEMALRLILKKQVFAKLSVLGQLQMVGCLECGRYVMHLEHFDEYLA